MKPGKSYFYTLSVEGTTHVHSVKSDFKTQSKNELIFKGQEENGDRRYLLKELNYELRDYEDPVLAQIAELTNKVCSIYEELDFVVNRFGELVKILNRKEIKEKWGKIKDWLIQVHPIESYEVIRAKEFEMSNEKREINNVKYIHFMQHYFFMLGRALQPEQNGTFRKDEMDRFGAGIVIPIHISYHSELDKEDNYIKQFTGMMIKSNDVIERLQKFTKNDFMTPSYKMTGKYIYDKDKILTNSDFTITEELGEHYHTHSHLNIKQDEENIKEV
jgi:hypothetical protein